MILLKTDHYIWGWKRNYYVIWSRDVKTEVTNDNFRFEMPRKHLTIYISECISEIDIFSGFNLTKIVWNAIFVISHLRLVTCLRWNFIPTKLSRNNYSLRALFINACLRDSSPFEISDEPWCELKLLIWTDDFRRFLLLTDISNMN